MPYPFDISPATSAGDKALATLWMAHYHYKLACRMLARAKAGV